MLLYLTAGELARRPALQRAMFEDRARQFHDRLGWKVSVDRAGQERDVYDSPAATYVICSEHGRHLGSMRFLPTTGRTMVNDHFVHLAGRPLSHPGLTECTRFCIAPDAPERTAARLMAGALEYGYWQGYDSIVGVFDARMVRIYARLGWAPVILGSDGDGRDRVSVGLWQVSGVLRPRLLQAANIAEADAAKWAAALRRRRGVAADRPAP